MKSTIKQSVTFTFLISILLISSTNVLSDANVDVIPEEPKALQDVEITSKITDENINAVYLEFQECDGNTGICYSKENISMNKMVGNMYTSTITLSHDDATYFQYSIIVDTDQGWITYNKDTKVYYDTSSSNTNGGNNDNDDTSDTPGFEFIVFSLSIILITLILFLRKR